MGELTKWAQDNSPWLKIPDNGEVLVKYLKFELVDDPRNPGKQKVRYTVELEGKAKWFESTATKVAMSFDTFKEGDLVVIKKTVENNKVRYSVEAGEKKVEEVLTREKKEKIIKK